jgi:hypothetical protein
MLKKVCLITASLLWSFPLAAQSRPSAEGPGISVWVGASISTFNPDYGCANGSPFSCWNHHLIGITPYAHTKPFLFQRIGAEGEARFLHWHGPEGMSQQSYLAGPRIYLIRYKRLIFNGKFMLGAAHLTLPPTAAGEGTYFAYAPGLDLDYRLARRIALHADYEFQSWPSFKGTGTGQGGLTPNGLSVGVSYAILQ